MASKPFILFKTATRKHKKILRLQAEEKTITETARVWAFNSDKAEAQFAAKQMTSPGSASGQITHEQLIPDAEIFQNRQQLIETYGKTQLAGLEFRQAAYAPLLSEIENMPKMGTLMGRLINLSYSQPTNSTRITNYMKRIDSIVPFEAREIRKEINRLEEKYFNIYR